MPFRNPSWEWYAAPNVFPLAMAACLAFCALFVGLRGLVNWRRDKSKSKSNDGDDQPDPLPPRWIDGAREWGMGRFIAGALLIALLIYLLGKVNFYLLAPGSIIVFGLAFRSDPLPKALKSALIAAVFITIFLYVISRIFGIVFP
jgi:hypothetical protein